MMVYIGLNLVNTLLLSLLLLEAVSKLYVVPLETYAYRNN